MSDKIVVLVDDRNIITRIVQCSQESDISLVPGESVLQDVDSPVVGWWVSQGIAHKRKTLTSLPTCDSLGNISIIPDCPLTIIVDNVSYTITGPTTIILPTQGAYQLHIIPITGEYMEEYIRVDY